MSTPVHVCAQVYIHQKMYINVCMFILMYVRALACACVRTHVRMRECACDIFFLGGQVALQTSAIALMSWA